MPRPWLFEAGVLRFLSHRTVPPCVGRVEESAILGEGDPFAQGGIKCEFQIAISRPKWGWLRFEKCVIPLKALIADLCKAWLAVSQLSLSLVQVVPLSHPVAVRGTSQGRCGWGSSGTVPTLKLERGTACDGLSAGAARCEASCPASSSASWEFLKELPANSPSGPIGFSWGPGSCDDGICCLS